MAPRNAKKSAAISPSFPVGCAGGNLFVRAQKPFPDVLRHNPVVLRSDQSLRVFRKPLIELLGETRIVQRFATEFWSWCIHRPLNTFSEAAMSAN